MPRLLIFGLGGAVILLGAYNAVIAVPVGTALAKDARDSGITLVGYRSYLWDPSEVTLDLWNVDAEKAPVDLFRCLFEAAEALKSHHFSRVALARSGKRIFVMSGDDFQELGRSYSASENPLYLIRTIPEKLLMTDGTAAYGTWTGGWLGVLTHQMQDVTKFAADWTSGAYKADVASGE